MCLRCIHASAQCDLTFVPNPPSELSLSFCLNCLLNSLATCSPLSSDGPHPPLKDDSPYLQVRAPGMPSSAPVQFNKDPCIWKYLDMDASWRREREEVSLQASSRKTSRLAESGVQVSTEVEEEVSTQPTGVICGSDRRCAGLGVNRENECPWRERDKRKPRTRSRMERRADTVNKTAWLWEDVEVGSGAGGGDLRLWGALRAEVAWPCSEPLGFCGEVDVAARPRSPSVQHKRLLRQWHIHFISVGEFGANVPTGSSSRILAPNLHCTIENI